jgi:hypothetical protein
MSMAPLPLRRSRLGSGNLFFFTGAAAATYFVFPSRCGATAVEFLLSFRLFLSKKLIMIEILRSFLLYQHVHFI